MLQQEENRALRLKSSEYVQVEDKGKDISVGGGGGGGGVGGRSYGTGSESFRSNPEGNSEVFVIGESNYAKGNNANALNYDSRQSWRYFDEKAYIKGNALKEGEDPYFKNKFNQAASDQLPSNREIPDTRGQA